MDDLITKRQAVERMNDLMVLELKMTRPPTWNEVYNAIKELPSAQKKGHWRNYEGTLTCSVCETEIDNGIMEYCGDDVPMFCPNCGADMRGEEDGSN